MLVDISLATPGVIGARMVGAGLGGSIVIVVVEEYAQKLLENLVMEYYNPCRLQSCTEIVKPVGGANVMDI